MASSARGYSCNAVSTPNTASPSPSNSLIRCRSGHFSFSRPSPLCNLKSRSLVEVEVEISKEFTVNGALRTSRAKTGSSKKKKTVAPIYCARGADSTVDGLLEKWRVMHVFRGPCGNDTAGLSPRTHFLRAGCCLIAPCMVLSYAICDDYSVDPRARSKPIRNGGCFFSGCFPKKVELRSYDQRRTLLVH